MYVPMSVSRSKWLTFSKILSAIRHNTMKTYPSSKEKMMNKKEQTVYTTLLFLSQLGHGIRRCLLSGRDVAKNPPSRDGGGRSLFHSREPQECGTCIFQTSCRAHGALQCWCSRNRKGSGRNRKEGAFFIDQILIKHRKDKEKNRSDRRVARSFGFLKSMLSQAHKGNIGVLWKDGQRLTSGSNKQRQKLQTDQRTNGPTNDQRTISFTSF